MPEKNLNEVNKQVRDLYEKGLASIERNALDAAMHFFTEAITFEPGFLKARQALRIAQIKKSSSGGALSKVFGSVTSSTALATAMANVSKNPTKAMEAAEKVLASNPYNVQALKALGQAAANAGYSATAIFAYETAREGSPKNVSVLLELGILYQDAHESDKARDCFEQILKIDPNHREAYSRIKDTTANEAMRKGKWEEAESYRDMIKDIDEAVSLEQAGKITKDEDIVRAQMADVYKQTQQQPDNVAHWKKLGDLSVMINEFDYAIQYYQHAFGLTKNADGTIDNLISETKIKKVQFQLRQKESELAANPGNEALTQEVANLNQEYEKTVLEECEARARRYPNDLDIRFELAQIYYKNGLIDKALKEFQVASANPKNKVSCFNWLGKCFKEKGMLDMAIQRFKSASEQALVMDGVKKDILYNLGLTYEQMGKRSEAIEQYKVIYDVDIEFKDVSKKIEDFYREQPTS